jgi:hypothetical protein
MVQKALPLRYRRSLRLALNLRYVAYITSLSYGHGQLRPVRRLGRESCHHSNRVGTPLDERDEALSTFINKEHGPFAGSFRRRWRYV